MPQIPTEYQQEIEWLVERLSPTLGENLYSCILYGSAVTGNIVRGVSDINILIVLNESTPDAHTAIADCHAKKIRINYFVIGRKGVLRSFRSFPIKFRSIKRKYQLLYGVDIMKEFTTDNHQLRFICEQAIRNLRLRSVHNYVEYRDNKKRYLKYLHNIYAAVFTDISEILRLANLNVSGSYDERIVEIEKYFSLDASILRDLLKYKRDPKTFFKVSVEDVHSGLFILLNSIVMWMEEEWPVQE